jgi:predicted ATPase
LTENRNTKAFKRSLSVHCNSGTVSENSGNRKQKQLHPQSHDQTFFHKHSAKRKAQQGFYLDQPHESGCWACRIHPVQCCSEL